MYSGNAAQTLEIVFKTGILEAVYPVVDGVSYNSYLLIDDKTILFDTVDKHCADQFFENLKIGLKT